MNWQAAIAIVLFMFAATGPAKGFCIRGQGMRVLCRPMLSFATNQHLAMRPVMSATRFSSTADAAGGTLIHKTNLGVDLKCSSTASELEQLKAKLKSRPRRHVNPLTAHNQIPKVLSDSWVEDGFANPLQPVHVDIGCAMGEWNVEYAKQNPNTNILGLEIRQAAVDRCLYRKALETVKNAHFLQSNANVDISNILSAFTRRNIPITGVSIQFPDPHFKKKHHRRRVVNEKLVNDIARYLEPGTPVFIQSDIKETMLDMVGSFKRSIYFTPHPQHDVENLSENFSLFTLKTEREAFTLDSDLPVYRLILLRSTTPIDVVESVVS